ncbi:MAG: sugar dehydrogenase, partial [Thermoleophilia bacterium]
RYLALGGPASMGLPTSDETDVPGKPGARLTILERGRIYWSAGYGPQLVYGAILAKYLAMGGPAGAGLPTSDEYATPGGRVSNLQSGRIYWSPETGPHHVCGAIMAKYDQLGGTAGMGFPLTDEINAPGVSGGRMSEFSRGSIYWSLTTGSVPVYGAILAKYKAVGASQTYGLPIAEEKDINGKPGAREGQFERGRIYWSLATGTNQVYGAILARYLLGGGPAGPLGLPVSDEYGVPGGRRTNFQGGYIVWNYFGGGTSVVTTH